MKITAPNSSLKKKTIEIYESWWIIFDIFDREENKGV